MRTIHQSDSWGPRAVRGLLFFLFFSLVVLHIAVRPACPAEPGPDWRPWPPIGEQEGWYTLNQDGTAWVVKVARPLRPQPPPDKPQFEESIYDLAKRGGPGPTPLKPPANVTASQNRTDMIAVRWDRVSEAAGYDVARAPSNDPVKALPVVEKAAAVGLDHQSAPAGEGWYFVRTVGASGAKSGWSSGAKGIRGPPTPPPPPPMTDLNVAVILPEPHSVRGLTPDQVAILSSTILRKYLDQHCGKDDDGKTPAYKGLVRSAEAGLLSPRWKTVLDRTPKDKPILAAVNGDKWAVVPLPANVQATLAEIEKLTGVKAETSVPWEFPTLREPPPEAWARYNPQAFAQGPDGKNIRYAVVGGEKRYLALEPRDRVKHPVGSLSYAKPLSAYKIQVIPRSEWPARIAALKAANAGLMPLTYPIPPYDQDGTNYCWCNCVVQGWVAMAEQQHRPRVILSAASVGGPITGYRNVGGYPGDAIAFVLASGGVNVELWPSNAIKSSYAGDAKVKADYPLHKLAGSIADLGASGKMFDEVATCVLLGSPVAVCYNWWSHAVLAVGVAEQGGKYYLILRNSWGQYEDNGFFLLQEGKGTPDDAQAILSVQQASSRRVGRLLTMAA